MSQTPPEQPAQPQFNSEAQHQNQPKLRRVRGVPVPVNGPEGKQITMLGIADSQQISTKMVVTHPAFQTVLPMMDGSRTIDQIVAEAGQGLQRPMLEQLVAQLDDAGLIYGPNYEALAQKMRDQFDEKDTLPPGSTAQMADMLVTHALGGEASDEQKQEMGAQKLAEQIDAWIAEALKDSESPSLESLPAAIIAPHLDYVRGWMNYAHVYGRMRVVDRPDRIVILGTNHFGQSTGICGCDEGFETPLGTCKVDQQLLETLKSKLGDEQTQKMLADRYDHENEHSIELHIPWIQHVFGKDANGEYPQVFAALIHDPTVNNGESYDENGLGLDPFVEALKSSIGEVGGKTLIVSSADLSHVGPAFGDQQALAGEDEQALQFRSKVAQHDQEMLKLVADRKIDDLISSMAWQQNPTRWCSIGNITAMMRTVEPSQIDVLNYAATMDPNGTAFVSSASIAVYR
ncbi:MAG TPA: AmmeMemoRadiSam system protein B [Phycisphaerales bacterium]|nr:AmmeMemoRadiSam system protein B [Phycisphaerales bacterium]